MLYHSYRTLNDSIMNKQETVIKICKITRITGEIKCQLDLAGEVDFAAFIPDLLYIDKWAEEICEYVSSDPCPRLAKLIANMGFNDAIEKYVQSHRTGIKPAYQKVLDNYVVKSHDLFKICEQNSTNRKGEYVDLIEPLANKQVADLLDRAVKVGLLDEHYQPIPNIKALHLKLIAYAIATICKFKRPYHLFEKQWNRNDNTRISACRLPKYADEYYDTIALYPEVDFSKFEPEHEISTFYVTQDEQDINAMYENLIKHGYIASDTSFETFKGIVGKSQFTAPVEWVKGQRQLSFYIQQAFGKYNDKDLWIKGETCFTINGNTPHKGCFTSGYSFIKRTGLIDNYDIRLKAICDTFNHIDTPIPQDVPKKKRLIHTSKNVFFSQKSEEKKKAMYSALVSGGFIAPDTAYATFEGILEESKFTNPIVWMKSQNQLIYFVHLAFKEDNPYDLWVKCVYCFRFQNGKAPCRSSLDSNLRPITKQYNVYNQELKTIADDYNDNSNNSAEASDRKDAEAHSINT